MTELPKSYDTAEALVEPDSYTKWEALIGYKPEAPPIKEVGDFKERTRELAKPLTSLFLDKQEDADNTIEGIRSQVGDAYNTTEGSLSSRFTDLYKMSDEEAEKKSEAYIEKQSQEQPREQQTDRYDSLSVENVERAVEVFNKATKNDDSLWAIKNAYIDPSVFPKSSEMVPAFKLKPDQKLKDPLSSYREIDELRTNEALRCAVLEYLQEKLEKVHWSKLTERGIRNDQKVPSAKGYETIKDMKSREYVALLALSMMDGSFDYSKEENISESMSGGEVVAGQHRWMARSLLDRQPERVL